MASRRGLSTSSSESESDDKTKRKMKTHNKSEIETSDSDVSISEEKGYPFEVDGYEMKKLEQKGYIFNGVILGTGSFGVIYECVHQGHKLACKKYHIQMAMERNNDFDEVEFLQEIENEIQILNVINHPNCIKLYSVERMHKTPSSTPQSSPRGSSKGTPKQSPKELNRQQRKETLKESPASSTSSRTTSTSISSAVSLTQSTTLLFTERCHGDFKRFKRDFGTNNALNEDQNGKWFVQITMALKYLHWGDKEFKDGTEKNAPIMFWDLHEGNILFKGTVKIYHHVIITACYDHNLSFTLTNSPNRKAVTMK